MKVIAHFNFSNEQLRTVRAAHGRGGKATRKECLTFLDRALAAALKAAPDPRPVRKRLPKPEPKPAPAPVTPDEERAAAIAARDKIAAMYRRPA